MHTKTMVAMACDVNTTWNFCNEKQYRSLRRYTTSQRHGLLAFTLGTGSFCEDAHGRWYRNVCAKYEAQEKRVPDGATLIGIDSGRRTMATCSDGSAFTMLRCYRLSAHAPGVAQRASKKRRVRAIHARIGSQRQDTRHKKTTALVKQPAAMFVGNGNATALVRTGMAHSVPDAVWSTFMTQRRYNAMRQCGVLSEVSEALSTRTCPGCGTLPQRGGKVSQDLE